MTYRVSDRLVIPTVPTPPLCVVVARSGIIQKHAVRLNMCKATTIRPHIAQGADQTFRLLDSDPDIDYSGATEITFDIWQDNIGGTSLLSLSLTGSRITVPQETYFQFKITDTESGAFPAGNHYCEAWVTLSSGDRVLVGSGPFTVNDTRKFDA